jgi:hypothetical protein
MLGTRKNSQYQSSDKIGDFTLSLDSELRRMSYPRPLSPRLRAYSTNARESSTIFLSICGFNFAMSRKVFVVLFRFRRMAAFLAEWYQ